MTFVLASNNKKKIMELRDILSAFGIDVISQREAGLDLEVEEDGKTFYDNALLKASAACKALNMPAISDDSGLAVEALNGEPGVWSARYGGEGLSDVERYELLLKNMAEEKDRTAKFVSSIVCVFPNGDIVSADGECCGEILYEPIGDGGFGYDPIFHITQCGKSMAEITAEEKNAVSHRGNALRAFSKKLEEYLAD